MNSKIHPTAIIEPTVELGNNVEIGAYSIIRDQVIIADGVKIHPHVIISGKTSIGRNTEIFSFSSLGTIPQSEKYQGENSRLVIGENCFIREHVTINLGTKSGRMETTVGDRCYLMVGTHIAHDCILGNHVVIANNVALAGHVVVEDECTIGGHSVVLQFSRIGKLAMICGFTGVGADVAPYTIASGERAHLHGLNVVGLRRHGFTKRDIHLIHQAYKEIFCPSKIGNTLTSRLKYLQNHPSSDFELELIDFIKTSTQCKHKICTPRNS
jgi:UDP-N-acetylglucosamine acyltransferase